MEPESPQVWVMPALVGLTPAAAEQVLNDAGLSIGSIYGQASDFIAPDLIADTSPPEGTSRPAAFLVDLYVSTGPRHIPAGRVPDVQGQVRDVAVSSLEFEGYCLSGEKYVFDVDIADGAAIFTEPRAGTLLDPGLSVFLYVSLGDGGPVDPIRTAPPTTVTQ